MMNRRAFMKSVAFLVAAGKRLPDLLTRKAVVEVEEVEAETVVEETVGVVTECEDGSSYRTVCFGEPIIIYAPTNDILESYESIYVQHSKVD